jgi:hypothetical protein
VIAALYVDERGLYYGLGGVNTWVDCWGESRDARRYCGPHPVVAHPPCGPWGSLKHLAGGSDRDCGPRAVEQVRSFGGVLEHPAKSTLWSECCLPLPGEPTDTFGGFSVEVAQCAWGHVARKKTWLYVVRVPREVVTAGIRTGGTPTHWISGSRKRKKPGGGVVPRGIKVCSDQQRRRTPVAFAQWLVSLAMAVTP